ncbi:MAG: hypothetical protein ACI91B_005144 [Planctomycetota bacterium]
MRQMPRRPPPRRSDYRVVWHDDCNISDMSMNTEKELQTLLSGEVAAAETYTQAIDALPIQHQHLLRGLRERHGDAIKYFHDELQKRGVEPQASSGAWGHFAKAVERSALMVSHKLALKALRAGEERGLAEYLSAARSANLAGEHRTHIETKLVPAQHHHVSKLDKVLQEV